jgi:pyruvate kinase
MAIPVRRLAQEASATGLSPLARMLDSMNSGNLAHRAPTTDVVRVIGRLMCDAVLPVDVRHMV